MANPNHPTRAETPMAFIRAMVEAYTQRGLDPSSALRKAQITPSQLKSTNARVTTLQMEWMSEAAMRELDDEALGWFRRRLPWGSYGMLVRASLTAPNLGVALQRWCRHHKLLTEDIVLTLTQDKGVASLALHEHHPLGRMREFCTVSVLRNALGVACWLSDSRIALSHTELNYPAPAHVDSYRVLFEGPTHFDAPVSRLCFDAGYLQLPVRRDEAALQRMLERALLLIERNIFVYRSGWLVILSGFFEPLFYLLSIGLGIGALVGGVVVDGQEIPYTAFVAPALLASSAMNGATSHRAAGTAATARWAACTKIRSMSDDTFSSRAPSLPMPMIQKSMSPPASLRGAPCRASSSDRAWASAASSVTATTTSSMAPSGGAQALAIRAVPCTS